jgi:hypothetical protein
MNISVDASHRWQVSELWRQYQSGLGKRIFFEPPMHGPDAQNLLNFVLAPEDFVRLLEKNRIPYTVN